MKSYLTLLKNEGKLSVRDMNMIIFSIAMPLVVLVVLGIIYGGKPAVPGADHTFLEQSFGAVCGISMCAGGLMGLPIVVSDYRERKILKRFQVTPMSPMLLLIVELSIYIFYCVISLLLCGVAATVFWRVQLRGNGLAFFGSWLLTMLSTLSIGLLVGSQKQQTGQRNRLYTIFSHVDFFRHNSSAGNSAESDASGSPFLPIYYGGCADERNIFGDCRRKCHGYSRRDDWSNCALYGSCRKAFQMGITERIRG